MPVILPETGTITTEPIELYVTPSVPSAPPEEVTQKVRDAAIEFCRRTQVWTEQLPDITTIADTETYDLDRPTDSEVFKLLSVQVDGLPWSLKTYAEGLAARLDDSLSLGDAAFVDPISRLHLAPKPTVTGQIIKTNAGLVPTVTGATLPGLLEPYAEDIAYGALMRFFRQHGTDWFDVGLAEYHRELFNGRIQRLGLRVARGMSSARMGKGHARPNRFR